MQNTKIMTQYNQNLRFAIPLTSDTFNGNSACRNEIFRFFSIDRDGENKVSQSVTCIRNDLFLQLRRELIWDPAKFSLA